MICKSLSYLCLIAAMQSAVGISQSISNQAAMHARVRQIYDFSPSKVTAEQRKNKSAEMDSFWSEIKSHKNVELPLLRKELQDDSNPSFFFSDGSGLLLTLSQSAEDENLAAHCLARVNFEDFQSRQYLYQVHSLAIKGVDVTPAALHMLDDPKFDVYLPEHGAYHLDQAACVLEALLPLSENVWLFAALQRIKKEQDPTATKSLLLLLYYAQTDEADSQLRSIVADSRVSKEEREFTAMVLKHERDLGLGRHSSRTIEAEVREERRKRMFGLSDEAMDDLEDLTRKLAQARTLSTDNH